MQIQSIEAKNFKTIGDLRIEPSKINIVLGPNGTGKSTLLDALRYAITGKSPADMQRLGTKTGYVIADVKGVGKIQRGWTASGAKFAMNGKATSARSIADSIKELSGINLDAANVMTSGELFAGMQAGDISKFLIDQGFLRLSADVDKIIAYSPRLSEKAQEELRMYFPAAPDTVSTEEIKAAYQYYFDARRVVKRDVEEAKAGTQYEGPKPTAASADIATQRDELAKRFGKAKAETDAYKSLKASWEKFASAIQALQAKADAIAVEKPEAKSGEVIERKLADAQRQITEKERTASVLKDTEKRMTQLLSRLGEPVCPISDKLVCTTDKTAVSAEVQAAIDAASKEHAELQKQLAELALEKNKLESEKTAFTQNAAKYQEKTNYLAQIEEMKKNAPKEPKAPAIENVEALQEQLNSLNEAYGAAVKYEAAEIAMARHAQLAEKLAVHEELVDALNPKNGIIQKVIEKSVIPLEDHCNDRIPFVLPKYRVKFDTTDGIRVMLADRDGRTISYESVSRGEKLRVRFLILDMLNALSGFRVLMIDDIDSLDKTNLAATLELIADEEIAGNYDHVFICGVNHADVETTIESAFAGKSGVQRIAL